MKTFKEYLLDSASLTKQTVYLPTGAEVLRVSDTDSGLMLLVLADSTINMSELRTFKICLKDENLDVGAVRYVGSFDSSIGTKYVIEILKEFD